MLDQYQAVALARASKSQAEQVVNGRQVKYKSDAEIDEQILKYKRRYRKEQARKNGTGGIGIVKPRFCN